jgi:hypothetical protein
MVHGLEMNTANKSPVQVGKKRTVREGSAFGIFAGIGIMITMPFVGLALCLLVARDGTETQLLPATRTSVTHLNGGTTPSTNSEYNRPHGREQESRRCVD